jgi:hypothetical protein
LTASRALRRNAAAVTAAAFAVVSLTSCEPAGPTVLTTPEVRWEPAEPSSTLRDDPYAQAALASSLGMVLAFNADDFTIAQLTDHTTQARVQRLYEDHVARFVERDADPIAWAGPLPQTVLDVTENAAGDGADVLICDVSAEWYIDASHTPTLEGARPTALLVTVVTEDDALKVDSVEAGGGECDPGEVALGLFEPAPVPADDVTESSVRAPLSD